MTPSNRPARSQAKRHPEYQERQVGQEARAGAACPRATTGQANLHTADAHLPSRRHELGSDLLYFRSPWSRGPVNSNLLTTIA